MFWDFLYSEICTVCHGCGSCIPMRKEPPAARFWRKVVIRENGCWEWTAYRDDAGYGTFSIGYTMWRAHRWAYETYVASVPSDLQLDHLCRNPSCVNPLHLEVVTTKENVLRGIGITARNSRKTHCRFRPPTIGREPIHNAAKQTALHSLLQAVVQHAKPIPEAADDVDAAQISSVVSVLCAG